jgi:hypothetical protein
MRIYFNEAIKIKALYVNSRNKLEIKHVVRLCIVCRGLVATQPQLGSTLFLTFLLFRVQSPRPLRDSRHMAFSNI